MHQHDARKSRVVRFMHNETDDKPMIFEQSRTAGLTSRRPINNTIRTTRADNGRLNDCDIIAGCI